MILLRSYNSTDDWGNWNPGIHKNWSQKARYHRAYEEEFCIEQLSKESQTAIINGYNVTLSSCSCPDFRERQFPCKHIYRLAGELEIIKIPEIVKQQYTIDDEAVILTIKWS